MKNKTIICILITISIIWANPLSAQNYFDGLLAGIANYPGAGSDLDAPVNDINVLYTTLRTHQNWDDIGDLTTLADSLATESTISDAIGDLRQSSEHKCLFYYSGHGSESGLTPYSHTEETITKGELSNLFTTNKFIWILNSCYSGQFASVSDGIVLTACSSTEYAYESREIDSADHSVFTSYIIDGLVNDTADDGDALSYVSVEELYAYADDRTTDFVEDVLYPDEDPRINTQHPQEDDNWSGECDLEASTGNAPAAPTHFVCDNPQSTGNPPEFSWTSSITATEYHIWRNTNDSTFINVASTSSTSWSDDSLQINKFQDKYSYKIKAENAYGVSVYSDTAVVHGIEFEKKAL
ncbi:caspase domain-containing protein [candidate division KSB1 bacterium]